MNGEYLHTFLTLSKLKNFTQAAQELFVSQSTVTNRIAELERETGKKLFVRGGGGGVTLTEEGKVFERYATRIVDMEEACLAELNRTAEKSHTVRVGATNAVYESFLKERVAQKLREGMKLKLVLGHSAELLQQLTDRLLDAVYVYRSVIRKGIVCRPFYKDELAIIASKKFNPFGKKVKQEQLGGAPCIMCNFAVQGLGAYLMELLPPTTNFLLEVDNSSKVLWYLKQGLGYSFLPRELVKEELESGELVEIIPADFRKFKIESYCLFREGEVPAFCED